MVNNPTLKSLSDLFRSILPRPEGRQDKIETKRQPRFARSLLIVGCTVCPSLGLLSSCKTEKSLRDSRISWVQDVLAFQNKADSPVIEKEVIQIGDKNMEFLTLEEGKIILVPAVESLNSEIAGRLMMELNRGRRILWLGSRCFVQSGKQESPYIHRLNPFTERGKLDKARNLVIKGAKLGVTGEDKRYALKSVRTLEGATQGRLGGNGNSKVSERDIVLMTAQAKEGGELPVALVHLRKGEPQEGGKPIRWGWLALDESASIKGGDEGLAWSQALRDVVELLKQDQHILGAGPEFTRSDGRPIVRVESFGQAAQPAAAPQLAYRLSALQEQQSKEWGGELSADSSIIDLPVGLPAGEYLLQVEVEGQHPAAVVTSRFFVGENKDPAMESLTVSNKSFTKNGQPFPIVGVNYWPFSALRNGPEEYAEPSGWMNPAVYDPVEVERDLGLLEEYGINAVSIQLRSAKNVPALNDFLRRCRRHQIYVHMYLPHLFTIERDFSVSRKIIEGSQLAEQEHVFAYDVAWEAHIGREAKRDKLLGKAWADWIKIRYGSYLKAEKAMTYPLRLDSWGDPQSPEDRQLSEDDDYRYMVLPYRRFFSNWLSMHYGEIKRFLRAQGLEGAIGARSGYGGTGNPWADRYLPADLRDGVRHFDYIGPEIWHLRGEEVRDAASIAAYGRFVGREKKPILWIEFGEDVLDLRRALEEKDEELLEEEPEQKVVLQYGEALKKLIPDALGFRKSAGRLLGKKNSKELKAPTGEDRQQTHFREMVRMAQQSGSAGFFAWWFPGGYRPLEKTDYGLMTSALTPRPALLEMRKFAEQEMIEWNKGKQAVAPGPTDSRGFSAWWEKNREVGRHALDGQINLRLQPYAPEGSELPDEAQQFTSDTAPLINVCGIKMGVKASTLEDVPFYFDGELEKVVVQMGAVKRSASATQEEMRVRVPVSGQGQITLHFGNNGGCKWLSQKNAKYPIQVVQWSRGYRRPVAEIEVDIDELETGAVTLSPRAIDLRDREPMRFYLECRGVRFAYTPLIRWVLTQ